MLKRVSVQIPGSNAPVKEGLVVTPECTAAGVLREAGLNGYELCASLDRLPFGKDECVYDKVADGGILHAYRLAEAGAGGKPPAFSFLTPLLYRRGWTRKGQELFGYYRTTYGSYFGKVRLRMFGTGEFSIHQPPQFLKNHPHWACFTEKDNGWYELHFTEKPNSLDEGIRTIELMISEAFTRYN